MSCQNIKEYKLVSKKEHSDIRYRLFNKYNGFSIYRKNRLEKSFTPKIGKYDVYSFICEFMGDSFTGERKLFHDYLILKVDPKNQFIIDGFQYTMEWSEPTPISDLYRVSVKNIKIKDGLNLDLLQMKLQDDYQNFREYLLDQGVLILNP
ncbi:MAG: hypothetical protein J6581_06950 [Apibacter sp.]|nr:hypothetical protein [Apibacter sp.]